MDRINLPGFSADASLYANTGTYRHPGAGYSSGQQQVVPQFWRGLWNAIVRVGEDLSAIGECAAATAIMGAQCGAILETGDVAACTDAAQEVKAACS